MKETGTPAISVLFLPDKGEEKDRFAIVLSNWPSDEHTGGPVGSLKDDLGAVAVLAFPHEVEVR